MKKISLIILIFVFITNSSYASKECNKYNNVLQQKEYKDCLAKNPADTSSIIKKDSKLMEKINLDGIKDGSKKVLGKLNTDSKLTDYIKKKIGR